MRWPWSRRKRRKRDEEARQARLTAERVLRNEQARLADVSEVAAKLAAHRNRNHFAEQMRIAFGGQK